MDFDSIFKEFSLNFGTRKYPGFSGFECRVSGRVRVLTLWVPGGFKWPKMLGLPAGFSGFGSPRASLIGNQYWSQQFEKSSFDLPGYHKSRDIHFGNYFHHPRIQHFLLQKL